MSETVQPAPPPRLPGECYVMSLTPFDRNGRVDEGALREHVQRMTREGVGVWPGSPATGEGALMSGQEIFRVLELVAQEVAGRGTVVAAGLELPSAARNLEYVRRARETGADAVQLYPPTLGHSFAPNAAMLEVFYDEVLSATDVPIVLSSNSMTGFEIPAAVLERPLERYPHVVGVFKNHPDQHEVAAFAARFAPRTTVLTMSQKLMFAFAAGAAGELDNLQNVAPRLCRSLHDALTRADQTAAGQAYRTITRLWSAISGFCAEYAAPRVVVYKAMLRILGLPGGHPRRPFLELGSEAERALGRLLADTGLREIEGLR